MTNESEFVVDAFFGVGDLFGNAAEFVHVEEVELLGVGKPFQEIINFGKSV